MKKWEENKWIKLAIISVGIIIIAFLIELFYFNYHSLFHSYEAIEYDLTNGKTYKNVIEEDVEYITEQVIDGETVKVVGEETDYIIEFPESLYIKKLHIKYKGIEEYTVKILIPGLDGYGKEEVSEYYDTAYPSYQEFYLNVGQEAEECKIRVVNNFGGEIESIGFSNELYMNPYRILFVVALLFIVSVFFLYKDLFENRLEIWFALICFLSGTMMILYIGTLRAGWDEQVHFERAYINSNFASVEWTESANIMRDATQHRYNTVEERKIADEYYEAMDDMERADLASKQRYIPYAQRSYITQSIFIAIARLLDMPFSILYMFGKFGNLLLYTFVTALAIKIAKVGKTIIAVVGLLPTSIFLASCYSYDSITIAFISLGIALWINEMINKEEKLKWTSALAIISCIVIGALSKGVYIPLVLLLCILPKTKFKNRRQRVFFSIGVIAVMLIMMYTFMEPVATNTFRGNMDWGGDSRNVKGDTGEVKQLAYMVQYPFTFLKLLFTSITSTFCDYMLGVGATINFAFIGALSGQFAYLITPLLLGLGFIQNEEEARFTLEKKYRWIMVGLVFVIIVMIWTALYMNFTVVGALEIQGVQARYYLPIMPILLYACRNKAIVCRCKTETYNRIIMAVSASLLLYGIYTLLLVPYNL